MLFVEPVCDNFISPTHIIFLFSILLLANKKKRKMKLLQKLSQIIVQISLLGVFIYEKY